MPYVPPELTTDVDTMYDEAVALWQTYYPAFEPDETSRVALILSAVANMSYEQAYVMAQQFDNIYQDFGEELFGIPALIGTYAEAATTWTALDTLGPYTIAAGEEITIDEIGFSVVEDVTIPAGVTTTAPGEVIVRAINVGEDANALSDEAEAVNSISWLDSITVVGASAGGTEPETTEQYRDRLTEELQTVSLTAVTAADYLKFARRVIGVYRAMVLDAYRPANLLTANQASLETDTTGWAIQTNVAIASSAAVAASGTRSLSLTSAAAGDMVARTLNGLNAVPVTAGGLYTARAEFRSAVSARSVAVGIEWLDAAGASLGAVTYGTSAADTTSGWTLVSYQAAAPALARYAVVYAKVIATGGVSEVHYVDKIALNNEFDTTWFGTSPNVLDPVTGTYGNPGHITVAAIDEAGQPADRVDVLDDLNARRLTGIAVHYLIPTYTAANITATITIDTTRFVAAEVITNVQAAIAAYVDPANWGKPGFIDETLGVGERDWYPDVFIRRDEVFTVINNVAGVQHVDSLSINGNTTTNVQMGGAVALPTPGTITVTQT